MTEYILEEFEAFHECVEDINVGGILIALLSWNVSLSQKELDLRSETSKMTEYILGEFEVFY